MEIYLYTFLAGLLVGGGLITYLWWGYAAAARDKQRTLAAEITRLNGELDRLRKTMQTWELEVLSPAIQKQQDQLAQKEAQLAEKDAYIRKLELSLAHQAGHAGATVPLSIETGEAPKRKSWLGMLGFGGARSDRAESTASAHPAQPRPEGGASSASSAELPAPASDSHAAAPPQPPALEKE